CRRIPCALHASAACHICRLPGCRSSSRCVPLLVPCSFGDGCIDFAQQCHFGVWFRLSIVPVDYIRAIRQVAANLPQCCQKTRGGDDQAGASPCRSVYTFRQSGAPKRGNQRPLVAAVNIQPSNIPINRPRPRRMLFHHTIPCATRAAAIITIAPTAASPVEA